MDISQNRDINSLNQNFKEKVVKFLARLQTENIHIIVVETLRTQERQHYLFGKGRDEATLASLNCPIAYAQPWEAIVTNTLTSNHSTGNAMDIAFDPQHHGSLYNVWYALREKVWSIWEEYGMERWGRRTSFVDMPHFQDWDDVVVNNPTETSQLGYYWDVFDEENAPFSRKIIKNPALAKEKFKSYRPDAPELFIHELIDYIGIGDERLDSLKSDK